MEYDLVYECAPPSVPGGTAVLFLHPSTAATDRIDTDFLRTDTDAFLVVSTRTTAREVKQKLDHYDVDERRAVIVDTLSIERGYSRRSAADIHYVAAPDAIAGILDRTEQFLASHDGKRRVSFDSISELAYYADEERAVEALSRTAKLLREYDAVGLFHVDRGVLDEGAVRRLRALCDGVVSLAEDGTITCEFPDP